MKVHPLILSAVVLGCMLRLQAGTAENWEKHCAKCHGPDGRGDTKMGKKAGVKDMTLAEYQSALNEEKAVKAIRDGLKEKNVEKMKPNKLLTDDEIKALIQHIRQFKK
jgi:cytochrome c553